MRFLRFAGALVGRCRGVLSLTAQEKLLIVCVLVSVILGVLVRHYRQLYRESHAQSEVSAAASAKPRDVYVVP